MKLNLTAFLFILLINFSCKKTELSTNHETVNSTAGLRTSAAATSILEWQKCYGSTASDVARNIIRTSDGGYIIAANTTGSNNGNVTSTNNGGNDAWIIKLNSTGAIEWTKTYGGAGYDWIVDVAETLDGFVFCGTTYSFPQVSTTAGNGWVVKISKTDGTVMWEKVLGGSAHESFEVIKVNGANEIIVAGQNKSADNTDIENGYKGGADVWVLKLSNTGDKIWSKGYGGVLNDLATCIVDEGANIIIAAESSSTDGDLTGISKQGADDCWLFKIDGSTGEQVQGSGKAFGGSGAETQTLLLQNPLGGFVMSARTTSNNGQVSGNHGTEDAWIVKLDAGFNIISKVCLGGSGSDVLRLQHIDATTGDIFLCGTTSSKSISGFKGTSDVWVARLDNNLTVKNSNAFGGTLGETGWSAAPAEGGFLVSARTESNNGNVTGNHGSNDVWLLKIKF